MYVRDDDGLHLLATAADAAAVGVAIFTLDEDERTAGTRGLIDRGIVGVLDAIERRWIIHPWPRRSVRP